MKFDTAQRQGRSISRLYSETGRLSPSRIVAFIYQNRLPVGLVRALFELAKALVQRNLNGHDR